jgi:hypothetical protein
MKEGEDTSTFFDCFSGSKNVSGAQSVLSVLLILWYDIPEK